MERGGRAAEREPLRSGQELGLFPLWVVRSPDRFPSWALDVPPRSWTGSKAHCCPDLATTLYGTICGIGLTYMVSKVVL